MEPVFSQALVERSDRIPKIAAQGQGATKEHPRNSAHVRVLDRCLDQGALGEGERTLGVRGPVDQLAGERVDLAL